MVFLLNNRYINYILNLANEIEKIGEIVAGTDKEKQVIDIIKKNLEDYVDELIIEYVPVTSWYEEICMIENNYNIYPCSIHPPYHGVIDIELHSNKIIEFNLDALEHKEVVNMEKLADKIVLIDMPKDPDDIATVAYILSQFKPELIVIRDKEEALRRIVVLNNAIALYRKANQLDIPVIHIKNSLGSIDKLDKSRIYAKSSILKSYGYNIIAKMYKKYNKNIYIMAHHDHWLSGGSDNVIGVSTVTTLAKIFKNLDIDNDIIFAFFTAEEGFPEDITSFYWLVGSRHHINKHIDDILNNTILAINIDIIYKKPLTISTSNIVLRNIINSHFSNPSLDYDNIVFDSFAFTLIGIPSITFNTFRKTLEDSIYHSNKDTIDNIDVEVVVDAVISMYEIINKYVSVDFSKYYNAYNIIGIAQNAIVNILPSEIVVNLYRLYRIFDKCRNCLERNRYMYFISLFNRIINTSYVNKDIGRKFGLRENTSFIMCSENTIPIPTGVEFKNIDECYRSIDFNLELLTYILFKHCY
jgi:Iap family predicted aminopeptidase